MPWWISDPEGESVHQRGHRDANKTSEWLDHEYGLTIDMALVKSSAKLADHLTRVLAAMTQCNMERSRAYKAGMCYSC